MIFGVFVVNVVWVRRRLVRLGVGVVVRFLFGRRVQVNKLGLR